jgi:hypothetical protein
LALERAHLGKVEVDRQKLFEFLGLADHKAASMRLPRNNICVAIQRQLLQHLVKPDRKGGGYSSTCWALIDEYIFICVVVIVVLHNNVLMTLFSAGAGVCTSDFALVDVLKSSG